MPTLSALRVRLTASWRHLAKELSAFGVVGVACFAVDLGLFQALYAHLGFGAVTAKLISTAISMTLAYFAHRYWSFSHRARTGVKREYSIFFLVNGLTLLMALAIVAAVRYPLGQDGALVLQVANVGTTVIGTLIRFVCYRKWVFVSADAPAAVAHRVVQEERRQAGPDVQRRSQANAVQADELQAHDVQANVAERQPAAPASRQPQREMTRRAA